MQKSKRAQNIANPERFGFSKEDVASWEDQPFCLRGKKRTGVLLVHGWTATPSQMMNLAKCINKKDYPVMGAMLPGHGTCPEDLLQVSGEDWIREVEESLNQFKKQHDLRRIIIGGVSLGGNLAILASRNSRVDGIILIGTPIHLKSHFYAWMGGLVLSLIKKYIVKSYPKGVSTLGVTFSYMYYPLKSVKDSLWVMRKTVFSLRKVTEPILILQTSRDYLVAKYSPWVIYNSVSSKVKKLQWIKTNNANHVFVEDEQKEAYEAILNFIESIDRSW